MAFGISRLFKSTDAGAPVINGVIGSLNTALKAILVNGYGSKSSLGWTLEFESGTTCVFRQSSGTKRYLRVDDSSTTGATARSYETMLDITNGTDECPPLMYSASSIAKSSVANATANNWFVIGDEAGFWIVVAHQSGNNPNTAYVYQQILHYFGDYNPYDPRNKWNHCMIGNYFNNLTIYPHVAGLNGSAGHYACRSSRFTRGASLLGMQAIAGAGYFGRWVYFYNGQDSANRNTILLNNNILMFPIRIYDSYTVMLGSLPGIFEPMSYSNSNTLYTFTTMPYIEFSDGSGGTNILCACNNNGSNSAPTPSTTSLYVFKAGKGFRNVQ